MKATWQGWTTGILGIWLFIAAFLNLTPTVNLWDNLIVGLIVATAGFAMIKAKPWQGWTAGLVALWLIIAAFVPSLQQHAANLWNDAFVGILFMIAGFGALGQTKSSEEHLGEHTHAHA